MSIDLENLKEALIAKLGWGNFHWPPPTDPLYTCPCGNCVAFKQYVYAKETQLVDGYGNFIDTFDWNHVRSLKHLICILCGNKLRVKEEVSSNDVELEPCDE